MVGALRTTLALLLAGLVNPVAAQAGQDCIDVMPSSPSSRFADEGDGTLVDSATQLMWMRCAVGQTWRGTACDGQPATVDWQSAESQAQQVNRSGTHFFNDWRVPSLRELATVTERRCTNPRVNLALFPGTPPATFWTSTGKVSGGDAFYVLDFAAGVVGSDEPAGQHHVRLVRQAP